MSLAPEYQRRAFADVGLSTWDAERLAGEHGCLSPSGTARDVLDVAERQRLMRAIAAAYASMYLRVPEKFLWMGFAAIAVHDGVRPATDLATRAAPWLGVASDAARAAFETNFAIFADLYWVHLAYLDGGLEALEALQREGALASSLHEGLRLIDGGRAIEGNRLLLRHEQEHSVTPVFTKYHRALAFATHLGLIAVPNRRLRRGCEAMGWSPRWAEDESYGPFAARWRWVERASWEPFVTLHRRDRGALHREVWRAVTGAPEL